MSSAKLLPFCVYLTVLVEQHSSFGSESLCVSCETPVASSDATRETQSIMSTFQSERRNPRYSQKGVVLIVYPTLLLDEQSVIGHPNGKKHCKCTKKSRIM